ncbi:hypothetical protein TIFTF001_056068, partial [Ficus carica]
MKCCILKHSKQNLCWSIGARAHCVGFGVALYRPARSKLRVGPCDFGVGPGFAAPKGLGHSVRLVSQSSDNLPLPAVEGQQ